MLELLAPAGSMDALRAAVQNGADAVYLGCGSYNARQSAKNFTPQALEEAVKYCHIRGVAVHLTLNTLVSDKELPEVCQLIAHAARCSVDAFIVQDLGVVHFCRQIAPDVPIHGSTQLTVHNLPGVQLCAAMGMSRVVLSRELSRSEIEYICNHSPIEIEVFAHGALCMCYSGQCYLSAAIGGRSANRGRCAQPCRQSYGYGRWEERYPLSLKDNCLVDYLRELEAMGVASIKLEGRMKRAEYVAAVTGVYRQALDTGTVTRPMRTALRKAFNRQGFTDGYYVGRTGMQMFGIRESGQEDEQFYASMRSTYETVEQGLVPVRFTAKVTSTGSSLAVHDANGLTFAVRGPVPEKARTMDLTEEALSLRLSKTGGTPYRCVGVKAVVEPGLMLSAAQINAMRRETLNQLTAHRGRQLDTPIYKPQRTPRVPGKNGLPELTVAVTSRAQILPQMLTGDVAVLYVPVHILMEDLEFSEKLAQHVTVAALLPRIAHDGELDKLLSDLRELKALGIRQALVGNLGLAAVARQAGMRLRGDFGLNLFNSEAVNQARELELLSACLSFEMTLPQIRDVSKAVPCEMLIYGRMPLMVTENCIIRGRTGECACNLGPTRLLDRTGAEFPIIKEGNSCRSEVLNGKKLWMIDRQEDLSRLGIWAARLSFTTENPKEVEQVLEQWREPAPFDPGGCTRGLYLRGLD